MEIAAAQVRPAQKIDAPRVVDAQDDLPADDFASELDSVSSETPPPAGAEKAKTPSKPKSVPSSEQTLEGAAETFQNSSVLVAFVAPPRASVAPEPTQTTQTAPQGIAPGANSPAAEQSAQATPAFQVEAAANTIDPAPELTSVAAPAAQAQEPSLVALASAATQQKQPQAAKKTIDNKPPETAPPPASAQSNAAAQPHAASQTAPSAGKKETAKDGGGNPPAGTPLAAAQTAHAKTPVTHGQEFKLDASAAAQAMQPASPTVQNAPAAAPALIAQNAPVFVPPEALGVAIARKALEGVNKFELRLDPPELGRLDVTLEVDEAGNTRAHIRAERPEALELLQREAKGMEQALRQAGLNLDQTSLSFSLNGRDGRAAQEQSNHGRRAKFHAVLPEDEIQSAAIRGNAPPASGVDLRV